MQFSDTPALRTDASAESVAIEDAVCRYFRRHEAVVAAVYLFGSFARGQARQDSDVDVAVLFRVPPPRTLEGLYLDWANELRRLLGRPVDLVVLDFADPDLAHYIRLDGRVLLEFDADRRVTHEVASRNAYFDLLPHLRRYRYPEIVR